MKKDNYLDPRTKSPDPDDLSSEGPVGQPAPRRQDDRKDTPDEVRPNPDSSAPHVPPPGD